MGKKGPEETREPVQAGGAASAIIASLTEANKAMRTAYDAEYSQRLQLVRGNEAMERETLSLEVEIKGLTDQGGDLDEVVTTLGERHDGIKDTVGGLTEERDKLASENNELAGLQKQLDEETSRLARLQQDYMSAVGKFREARKKIVG